MDVLGAVMGYAMLVFLGVLASVVIGTLAVFARSRALGAAFVLSLVVTLGLLAWPGLQRLFDPERIAEGADVSITKFGTGRLELDALPAFVADPAAVECRRSDGQFLFRTVTVTDAGQLGGASFRLLLFLHLDPVSVMVSAIPSPGETAVSSWSGSGQLERGDEFAGHVTFEEVSRFGEPGEWPAQLSGQIEWSCPLTTAPASSR